MTAAFDGTDVHSKFGVPRGTDGIARVDRAGGQPGEVSAAAIDGRSANHNSVAPLGQTAEPDDQPAQIRDLINPMDEVIGALRRWTGGNAEKGGGEKF